MCRAGQAGQGKAGQCRAHSGGLWLAFLRRSGLRKYQVNASAGKMKAMQGLVHAPISAFRVP